MSARIRAHGTGVSGRSTINPNRSAPVIGDDRRNYARSISEQITDRVIPVSHDRKQPVRDWVALNIIAWLNTWNGRPGLSIERVESRPTFGLVYNIGLEAGLNGTVMTFQVVVEELPHDSFRLTVMRVSDNNAPEIVWSKIGRS
jgi:hypothetical protein